MSIDITTRNVIAALQNTFNLKPAHVMLDDCDGIDEITVTNRVAIYVMRAPMRACVTVFEDSGDTETTPSVTDTPTLMRNVRNAFELARTLDGQAEEGLLP